MSDWTWLVVLGVTVVGMEIRFSNIRGRMRTLEKLAGLAPEKDDPL